MDALYQHPDGMGLIQFDAESRRLFLFNEAEGLSTYAAIGPAGLRDAAVSWGFKQKLNSGHL